MPLEDEVGNSEWELPKVGSKQLNICQRIAICLFVLVIIVICHVTYRGVDKGSVAYNGEDGVKGEKEIMPMRERERCIALYSSIGEGWEEGEGVFIRRVSVCC